MTDASNSAPRADLTKSTSDVASMFDRVAERYDLMDHLMTGGMDRVWTAALRRAVAPRPGERILDLAAGTGASSAALAAGGAEVVACDLSAGMIEVGRARHPDIEFVQGDALDLDFEEASFDAVTISYGLRNIPDPARALREMARVVRPRGRLVVCEFSTPPNALFRSMYEAYQSTVLPVMARLASSNDAAYDYLVESIRDWPDQEEVGRLIADNGWDEVEYRNLTGGIVALHRARKPLP
ncbi:class I SAM-dependent methyltransferase [Actinomyces sp. B33]|uniref:class I SAM-dependent methyltransferase n=1 Tax=Actinomyces sp. B33 TaxID=2942131 RepID=UPI00234226D9|nr:class I SAM-dependent methyltransferase [Actinomyces sp. B33]MDC4233541.1 class I SAM-dependent methyltransferase [Actinomyces sp. B33]